MVSQSLKQSGPPEIVRPDVRQSCPNLDALPCQQCDVICLDYLVKLLPHHWILTSLIPATKPDPKLRSLRTLLYLSYCTTTSWEKKETFRRIIHCLVLRYHLRVVCLCCLCLVPPPFDDNLNLHRPQARTQSTPRWYQSFNYQQEAQINIKTNTAFTISSTRFGSSQRQQPSRYKVSFAF